MNHDHITDRGKEITVTTLMTARIPARGCSSEDGCEDDKPPALAYLFRRKAKIGVHGQGTC
jgi:hypothetical protein